MVEIIPAIMPASFEDLREKTGLVSGLVSTVQIDLMDGVFVPEKTWPYTRSGFDEFIDTRPDVTVLPLDLGVGFEVDLMVANPEAAARHWAEAGARRVIVHVESAERLGMLIETLREIFGHASLFGGTSTHLGIALNSDTPIEAIAPFCHAVDFVQCMGIARIGYQGEPFDERVIPTIRDLRAAYPGLIISVDGGVNFESASRLIKAGANRLVAGSAIFGSRDIRGAIERLQSL